MTNSSYWFVNRPSDLNIADLDGYLRHGIWQHPDSRRWAKDLGEVRVGDRIALKTVSNKTKDLPFYAPGRAASAMTLFATGQVQGVDASTGVIKAAWTKLEEAKDWYFWTYMWPIWRVDPGKGERGRELIDFTFHGKPQNIAWFLEQPYWQGRYWPLPGFTWVPFYEEFASKLLEHREDRSSLVEALVRAAAEEPLLGYVAHDQIAKGDWEPMSDIDPFTLMATFNRGIRSDNRLSIAGHLGNELGVTAALPQDFAGVPVLNNQNSWFMSSAYRRQPTDIDDLWDIFAAALALADQGTGAEAGSFAASYDKARRVRGVRWKLSVGLYWVRPMNFPTLDSRSREYIDGHYGLGAPEDGAEYLTVRSQLMERFGSTSEVVTSFPWLSYAAWATPDTQGLPHSVEGMARWATRIATSVNLDEVEHAYKRNVAAVLAECAQQAEDGDAEWTATFKRALAITNTIDFRFKDSLAKSLEREPGRLGEVFAGLWEDPVPESLDLFQSGLEQVLGSVTPGNATALGALLLMAADPEASAPYSASRTETWYALTGFAGPAGSRSAAVRYRRLLEFLDVLAQAVAEEDGTLHPSRLEIQGMAWATTELDPPSDWSRSEQKDLLAWRGGSQGDPRAWLMRTKVATDTWLEEGQVSLAAGYLGSVAPGATLNEVKAAVEVGYQHQDANQRKVITQEYFNFLSVMKPQDLVVVLAGDVVNIGSIEGPPVFTEGETDRLRRQVSWESVVADGDLPAEVASVLDRQGVVVDITDALPQLQQLLELGPMPRLTDGVCSEDAGTMLVPADRQLAEALHMPVEGLQEVVQLLETRRQIVFYGPPGTGKTFIAKTLARHVVGGDDRSRVQLVQFHPSYAYEDFFEGYRPDVTEAGEATFTLQAGPLARIAADARENSEVPYVLVIDELNRANVAKVFGELYFLLEYRNESMQLQYRPSQSFRLPSNLYIIGTMNTADRSIAMLDAAMRRRFSFVELHPDEAPVSGVLESWLTRNDFPDERAVLLRALNAAIEDEDRDLRIGPSYLMRAEANTDEGLERVWKFDIMPLLEEHYYGRLTRDQIHARFGLEALRARLGRPSEAFPTEPSEQEPDELFAENSST
jgi:hypothetical protein